jgi:hypothetical protein
MLKNTNLFNLEYGENLTGTLSQNADKRFKLKRFMGLRTHFADTVWFCCCFLV